MSRRPASLSTEYQPAFPTQQPTPKSSFMETVGNLVLFLAVIAVVVIACVALALVVIHTNGSEHDVESKIMSKYGAVSVDDDGVEITARTSRSECRQPVFTAGDASNATEPSSKTAMLVRGVPFVGGVLRDNNTAVDVVIGGFGAEDAASVEVHTDVTIRSGSAVTVAGVNATVSGALHIQSGTVVSSAHYVGLTVPESLVASTVYTLPASYGDAGSVLTLGSEGALDWVAPAASALETVAALDAPDTWVLTDTLPSNQEHTPPGNGQLTATFAIRAGFNQYIDGNPLGGNIAIEKWADIRDVSGTDSAANRIQQGDANSRPARVDASPLRFNNLPLVSFGAANGGDPVTMTHANESFVPIDQTTGSHCGYIVADLGDPITSDMPRTAVWGAGYGPLNDTGPVGSTLYVGMRRSATNWPDTVYSAEWNGATTGSLNVPMEVTEPRSSWDPKTQARIFIHCFARDGTSTTVTAAETLDGNMVFTNRTMPAVEMTTDGSHPMFVVGSASAYPIPSARFRGRLAEMGVFTGTYEQLTNTTTIDVLATHLHLRYAIPMANVSRMRMSDGRRPLSFFDNTTTHPRHVFGVARDDTGGLLVQESMPDGYGAPRIRVRVAGLGRVLKTSVAWVLLSYMEPRLLLTGWTTPAFRVHASAPTVVNITFPFIQEEVGLYEISTANRLGLDVAIVSGGDITGRVVYRINNTLSNQRYFGLNVSDGMTIRFGNSKLYRKAEQTSWETVIADDTELLETTGYPLSAMCGRPITKWCTRSYGPDATIRYWAKDEGIEPLFALRNSQVPTDMGYLTRTASDAYHFWEPLHYGPYGSDSHPRNHWLVECIASTSVEDHPFAP